ncbi:23S rRNA (uracil(1939)-C(5))-methyltransferase RlmD [Thalassotalea profundi]|uniref:23S rRNA (Uracil(1939)-C(5))-methyltransferase RlmD n=1 Tax=Thalassotalea profundi TaxID=2036687 RepID=A0ABQ3INS6_9GAMM|nr:23S rRNA (uracil(1939)-C(5))-methyltransferase RlmD [Thalassotalea profundi]GHE85636.1 23S rRNA (uracil(1939)-C(5))-methyltransferase RlmD [Thalassotalea profundi]
MVTFFKPPKNKTTKHKSQRKLTIDSLSHEGVGITRIDNKVCFVEGALPKETILATSVQQKSRYERFTTNKVINESSFRIKPFCPHFDLCGGCQLQHLQLPQQLVEKQKAVGQLFTKFAQLNELNWQTPIESDTLHYRRSARIAVLYQPQKKVFQLGFRQQGAKKIVNIEHCLILEQCYQNIFTAFRQLLPQLKNGKAITHIQLCSVNHAFVIVRHIKPLPASDVELLKKVCEKNGWKLVLEGETENFIFIDQQKESLPRYQLNQQDLVFKFNFNNFIQVNNLVNQKMITQALQWLALKENENVLDLFCGIGNFSLAMAISAQNVVGIEGVESSVAVARSNAQLNAIENATFYCQDLTENMSKALWYQQEYDVLVLDPSRAGALDILQQLPLKKFKRILYISCDPVTLARDSKLITDAGFTLNKVALMNMFPHTKHIETMALFVKP